MKTIFTFLASLFLTVSAFAAARPTSALTITATDNSVIAVMVDGKRFEPRDNGIMIQGITDGSHNVKVYRETNSGIVRSRTKRYELIYNANVSVKKRTNLKISIARNGRVTMQESRFRNNGVGQENVWYDDGRDMNDRFDEQWSDYDHNYGYESGMNSAEFNRILKSIDKEWLESNKLKSAVQVVSTSRLSAAQVKEIVMLFGFENNKLEVAKQAYRNTVDKHNYDIIYDVLTFSASRNELDRFIRTSR